MEKINKIFYDKNDNIIKIGDKIHILIKGFDCFNEKSIFSDKKFSDYKRKNDPNYKSFLEKRNLLKENVNGENLYFVLNENNEKIEWVQDYEKEVFEIDNKICFGWEGGVTFLEDYKKEDLEIINLIKN